MTDMSQRLAALEERLIRLRQGDPLALQEAGDIVRQLRQEATTFEQQRAQLLSLYETGQELISIVEPQRLLETIMERAILLTQAERGFLVLWDEKQGDFEVAVARQFAIGEVIDEAQIELSHSLIRRVLASREPLITTNAQEDPRFWSSESIVAYQIRSVLATPLVAGSELVGAIYVDTRTKSRLFSAGDLNLLNKMANQAAVAIRMARLHEMTVEVLGRRALEASALAEIAHFISRTLDLEQILTVVLERAIAITGAIAGAIGLCDEEGQYFDVLVHQGYPPAVVEKYARSPWDTRRGIAGRVVRTGRPALVQDVARDPNYVLTLPGVRAQLAVPLKDETRVIGALNLEADAPAALDEDDLYFALRLADQVTIAIKNAQLYAEAEQRVRELVALEAIARRLTSTLDFQQIIELVLDTALAATPATVGTVSTLTPDRKNLLPLARRGYPAAAVERYGTQPRSADEGLMGRAVRTGQLVLVPDVEDDPDYRPIIAETRSELVLPLKREGRVIGVLDLESPSRAAFSKDDVRFVMHLAEHTAIAMQNARLYEEEQRRAREAVTMLQITQTVTSSLNLEEILEALTNHLVTLFTADRVLFGLLQEGQLLLKAGVGFSPEEVRILQNGYRRVADVPGVQRLLTQRQPIVLEDIAAFTHEPTPLRPLFPAIESLLFLPLVTKDRACGVVGLCWHHPRRFAPAEIALATAIANQAAVAVENARLYEEQRRLDRLTFLGQIAAGVAHNLRNPIAAIGVGLEYLAGSLAADDPRSNEMRMLVEEGKRIDRILEEILLVAHPPRLQLGACDLVQVLESCLQRHQDIITASGIAVEREYAPDLPVLSADAERLERACDNVILNACQTMPQGGTLGVKVHRRPAGGVAIHLTNTGPIIPPDVLSHIFEPFFTTKARGLGLGLTIASRIIQEHGGTISADSTLAEGTTFTIELPG